MRVLIISLKVQKNVLEMRWKIHRPIWSEVAVAARSLPCDRTIFVIAWLVMTVLRRNNCFQPIRGGSSVGLNNWPWSWCKFNTTALFPWQLMMISPIEKFWKYLSRSKYPFFNLLHVTREFHSKKLICRNLYALIHMWEKPIQPIRMA